MVEGTPLLRVQAGNRLEGSNPFVSATLTHNAMNINGIVPMGLLSPTLSPTFLDRWI